MIAAEIIRTYASLTSDCLDLMRATFGSLDKPSIYRSAEFSPRDGSSPQTTGALGDNVTFQVHGVGCRFELDSGEVVDVDWDPQGRAMFDSWRLLAFAESIGVDSFTRAQLLEAAVEDPELRQVKDGWFTWADSRHDLTRGSSRLGA